jgi:hypothetical protein
VLLLVLLLLVDIIGDTPLATAIAGVLLGVYVDHGQVVASLGAGMVAFPFDTIRARMSMRPFGKEYPSGLDCFKAIVAEEGYGRQNLIKRNAPIRAQSLSRKKPNL